MRLRHSQRLLTLSSFEKSQKPNENKADQSPLFSLSFILSVFDSSRKEANVNETVKKLKDLGFDVYGTTCHDGKAEERKKLIHLVSVTEYYC